MIVHQYMAMGVLFNWNWIHILKDTVRVTIPDLVLNVWWTVDVALGWLFLHSRGIALHGQRLLLHLALLTLFLIGFIREGEILTSKVIGIASGLIVITAVVVGIIHTRSNVR